MSDKQHSERTLRLSRDSSARSESKSKTSLPNSSRYSSSHCRQTSASQRKYSDSWKMYLLPEFRKDHFAKGSAQSSRRALNTTVRNDSLNISYRTSEASEVKLQFTPQRSGAITNQSFEYTLPKPLLSVESSQISKKSRLRKPVGVSNAQLNPDRIKMVMEQNEMLKEQVEYLRDKFQKCLIGKQKQEPAKAKNYK